MGKKTFFLNICEKYKVSKGKSHLPKINMEKRNEQEARKCLHYDSSMWSLRLQDWDLKSLSSCLDSWESNVLETESSSASRKDNTVKLSARKDEKKMVT